jgi:hypothetical protein
MKIYLAGSVPKSPDEEKNFDNWRLRYASEIGKFFEAEFIDPYIRDLDEADFLCITGNDCEHIKNCDFIVVNSEHSMGVGTAQEMVIAKYFNKPVVTILPKNTKHRICNATINKKCVEDWIHPFVFTFSDFIIEDIAEFSGIHGQIFSIKPKDISIIDHSISHFLSRSEKLDN